MAHAQLSTVSFTSALSLQTNPFLVNLITKHSQKVRLVEKHPALNVIPHWSDDYGDPCDFVSVINCFSGQRERRDLADDIMSTNRSESSSTEDQTVNDRGCERKRINAEPLLQ